jgi:hypothetical protein
MNVALKEWSAVIAALDRGTQVFLLRKGGIVEARRGFELRYREFLLFPTFEHQHARYLKPEYRGLVEEEPPGGHVRISHLARVADVLTAPRSIEPMRAADALHVWNDDFLRQRYAYRPDLALYLVVLRVFRLEEPAIIPARPSYAGCKSWVHLTEGVPVERMRPVLSEAEFNERQDVLMARLAVGSGRFEDGKQAAE